MTLGSVPVSRAARDPLDSLDQPEGPVFPGCQAWQGSWGRKAPLGRMEPPALRERLGPMEITVGRGRKANPSLSLLSTSKVLKATRETRVKVELPDSQESRD